MNPGKNKEKKKSESKQGNDDVMAIVFKLMEYTQGSNDRKEYMKLIMPVFVGAETLENNYKGIKLYLLLYSILLICLYLKIL